MWVVPQPIAIAARRNIQPHHRTVLAKYLLPLPHTDCPLLYWHQTLALPQDFSRKTSNFAMMFARISFLMCVLPHVAHFFILSLVQPCLPGRTQATFGAQDVRDIRKWSFGFPASAGQLGTSQRGCDECLSLLCCRCVCWRWFVVKVLIYNLFMKKKYFPIHRRLKCFSFIWVKCHKKEAKQDRCWLELTQPGELVLLLPECILATKYYAQRDIPVKGNLLPTLTVAKSGLQQ